MNRSRPSLPLGPGKAKEPFSNQYSQIGMPSRLQGSFRVTTPENASQPLPGSGENVPDYASPFHFIFLPLTGPPGPRMAEVEVKIPARWTVHYSDQMDLD